MLELSSTSDWVLESRWVIRLKLLSNGPMALRSWDVAAFLFLDVMPTWTSDMLSSKVSKQYHSAQMDLPMDGSNHHDARQPRPNILDIPENLQLVRPHSNSSCAFSLAQPEVRLGYGVATRNRDCVMSPLVTQAKIIKPSEYCTSSSLSVSHCCWMPY